MSPSRIEKNNDSIKATKTAKKHRQKSTEKAHRYLFESRTEAGYGEDTERRYFGIILVAIVLFFLLTFTVGITAYRKTLDGISLESEASAKKPKETVWIDADPAPAAEEYTAEATEPDKTEAPKSNADGIPYYDIPLSDDRQDSVLYFCKKYDLPPELVYAIMAVGSQFDEMLISDTGDYGIMQINEINHAWLTDTIGVTDFLDFGQNIHAGIYILSNYYHKYTDFEKIAMCYRYGESNAVRMWEEGVTETDYTKALVRAIASLKKR